MKRVYVTMPEIRLISTTSAGDVIGETPVRAANLRLSASPVPEILNLKYMLTGLNWI